jgi:hypothetical protein
LLVSTNFNFDVIYFDAFNVFLVLLLSYGVVSLITLGLLLALLILLALLLFGILLLFRVMRVLDALLTSLIMHL